MKYAIIFLMVFVLAGAKQVMADDEPVFKMTIKDHQFQPSTLHVPADAKVKVLIKNLGPEQEGFNSFDLARDKTVPEGEEVTVYLGPLDPGNYKFWSRNHRETMKGQVVVK